MKIVTSCEQPPQTYSKSIFLAGPSRRLPDQEGLPSWRDEALEILKELDYDGVVFNPEFSDPKEIKKHDLEEIIEWEYQQLNRADCIIFWIPRDLENFPAFTTNIEFGIWHCSNGKVVVGAPKEAPKNDYIFYMAKKHDIATSYDLKETIQLALDIVGKGSSRTQGERDIPLHVWNTPMFQDWYGAQKLVGNKIEKAIVFFAFIMPKAKKMFCYILKVDVWIKEENRVKSNEFVFSRTNISCLLLYHENEIVIGKEFRTPVNNPECFVYELPGGSSTEGKQDALIVASEELEEEIGLKIDPQRIKLVEYGDRQLLATLSSHHATLFKIELTKAEIEWCKSQKGITKGIEADTEQVYTEVWTLDKLKENNLVDWSMLGMIYYALGK